jgi:predicted glycoside hydrolase/deacetylase ChbG (UPF0249 family)
VNADDLGLHLDIDRGIEKAHREGVVTSTSISPAGETFDNGVEVCGRCPELDVGVHLTLVGERPLTDPTLLGGLVTAEGRFSDDHPALIRNVLTGRVSRWSIRRELEAQIEKVHEAGLRPTHLDAHQHVHLLPLIWPVVVELARKYHIGWVRAPAFSPIGDGNPGLMLSGLRLGLNALRRVRRGSLGTLRAADATPTLGLSGHLTVERILRGLASVPQGAMAELVVHPGVTTPPLQERYDWGFDWTGETAALVDPRLREGFDEVGVTLRSFAGQSA